MRTLRERGADVVGLDVLDSPFTTVRGRLDDRDAVRRALAGVTRVLHTATLHKPHVGSHRQQDFVDTNVTGTLTLLEEAKDAGVESVVFTSSTSAFGKALVPAEGEPAAWITEDVRPVVRNIYGATKIAAEDLCELAAHDGLPVIVLRTSRFFPEQDDRAEVRSAFDDANLKVNEFLYRRVDVADVAEAHLLAAERAPALGFGRFIISATTPFTSADAAELATGAPSVFARLFPGIAEDYRRWGWRMLPALDRVYDNTRARRDLGWRPRYDFEEVVELVRSGGHPRSPLAETVGTKGYHATPTGVYTL